MNQHHSEQNITIFWQCFPKGGYQVFEERAWNKARYQVLPQGVPGLEASAPPSFPVRILWCVGSSPPFSFGGRTEVRSRTYEQGMCSSQPGC